MKLAEILSGPETWCQGFKGIVKTDTGRYCLMGALFELHGYSGSTSVREASRLREVIQRNYGDGLVVWRWNDDPARTWDEVAAVIDEYDRDRMLNP